MRRIALSLIGALLLGFASTPAMAQVEQNVGYAGLLNETGLNIHWDNQAVSRARVTNPQQPERTVEVSITGRIVSSISYFADLSREVWEALGLNPGDRVRIEPIRPRPATAQQERSAQDINMDAIINRLDQLKEALESAEAVKATPWAGDAVITPPPEVREIQVPVERIVEVPVEVEKIVEVPVERIVEVPVEVERIVEVPVEVERIVERVREVPVPVQIEVVRDVIREVEVVKEIEVIREVPVEVIREVESVKPIETANTLDESDSWRNKMLYLRISADLPINFFIPRPGQDTAYKTVPNVAPGATIGLEIQFANWMSVEFDFVTRFADMYWSFNPFNPGAALLLKFPLKPANSLMIGPYLGTTFMLNTETHSNNRHYLEAGGGVQMGIKSGTSGAFLLDLSFMHTFNNVVTGFLPIFKEVSTNSPDALWSRFIIGLSIGYKWGFVDRP